MNSEAAEWTFGLNSLAHCLGFQVQTSTEDTCFFKYLSSTQKVSQGPFIALPQVEKIHQTKYSINLF